MTVRFNATTSDVSFGAQASQAPLAQTILALTYPIAAGEGNNPAILSRVPSASTSGPRFFISDTAPNQLVINGHSTGSAGAPQRAGPVNSITYGAWQHVCGTWTGGLTASTSIQLFTGLKGSPLTEVASYASASNGTTAADAGAANTLHIGNREATDRTFNGDIAYVAQWNRVLSIPEMRIAQFLGPGVVSSGLIMYWDGERDLGPYHMKVISKVALGTGFTVPPLVGSSILRRYFKSAQAAGGLLIDGILVGGGLLARGLAG